MHRFALLLAVAASLAACTQTPAWPRRGADQLLLRADPEADAQRVLALREDMAPTIEALVSDHGLASITIVAFDRRGTAWAESFGYANVARAQPADLDTVYNTGSTFKIVIVTAIMQLVERGALDLDTPVNAYLTDPIDDFTDEDAPLTLRHMLAHRAGLPPSRPVPDWDIWSRQSPPSIREQLRGLRATTRPGEEYDYCNVCFPLYADIIQNISGLALERYLRENILLPIDTRYTEPLYPDAQMVEHLALPYEQIGATPYPMPQKFLESWMSGDAYQRPIDMAAFLQLFLNGGRTGSARLLAPETVDSMMPAQFGGSVSLGFISELEGDRRVLWWDGGIYGGSSVYHLEPAVGIGVYVASNSNQTTDTLHALARRARNLLAGRDATAAVAVPKADTLSPIALVRDEMVPYVGTYALDSAAASVRVDILNDHLALTNPAGKRFDLVLTRRDRGTLIGPRETVLFEHDDQGNIDSLHIAGTANAVFRRVNGEGSQ